jgi:hypothetical protein
MRTAGRFNPIPANPQPVYNVQSKCGKRR